MHFRVLPLLFLSLPLTSFGQPPKAKPAAVAVAATPAKPSPGAAGTKAAGIISSDINGKDLDFVVNALDLGKALEYLTAEAAKAANPGLRGVSGELAKTLAGNSAVVSTVAEMRGIHVPADLPTQKRLAEKLGKLSGAKREKVLLDMFIEVDERMVATYESGRKSPDPTILKLSEQAFPQMQEHLFLVQSLAGMAPKRAAGPGGVAMAKAPAAAKPVSEGSGEAPVTSAPPKAEPAPAKPKATTKTAEKLEPIAEAPKEEVAPKKLESDAKGVRRPSFRMNVKPPGE